MSLILDVTDQLRLIHVLAEKAFLRTEEISVTDEGDRRAALDLMMAALELKRLVGDLHRITEDLMVETMGDDRRATVDGTTVEIRRAYRRTDWEHSKLAMHVALRATGGELVDGMDLIVDGLVKACRPEWRVSVLKELGLSDEDYCQRELGRASVSVL